MEVSTLRRKLSLCPATAFGPRIAVWFEPRGRAAEELEVMRVRWNGGRADLERRMMGRRPGRVEDGPKSAPHNAESGAKSFEPDEALGKRLLISGHDDLVAELVMVLEIVWKVPC